MKLSAIPQVTFPPLSRTDMIDPMPADICPRCGALLDASSTAAGRCLMAEMLDTSPQEVSAIVNWFEELRRRVPTGK
jgi:hypothetical protein